jgi:hypothetical protein
MWPDRSWDHSQTEALPQNLLPPAALRWKTQKVAPVGRTPDKKLTHLQPGFHTLNSTQFLAFTRTAAFEECVN